MARSSFRPKSAPELPEASSKNAEKSGFVTETRLKIGRFVDHPWYEKAQKVATYTSVFAEPVYRGACGIMGIPTNESVADLLRLGPLPLFAVNFGLKTSAIGIEHLKTPEAWIDAVSVAAEAVGGNSLGNLRLARLVKSIKGGRQVAKFMRTTKVAMREKSLEDKTMHQIGQDFTWLMMGMLATIPMVADFKDLDYSNPVDTIRELGFNVGMITMAKAFNSRLRTRINKNYTQTLDGSRNRVHQMIEENPELAFLEKEFRYFDEKAADQLREKLGLDNTQVRNLVERMRETAWASVHPSVVWQQWTRERGIDAEYADNAELIDKVSKDEILVIVEGLLESMISMKDLINPVGEDLELDEKGDIMTKEIDAIVMVTDLRNFTPLTTSKKIQGNIFGFLKLNYFAYLKHSIKQHGGKILNHTGDGLIIYFTDQKDRSKEENAIACAQEINKLTNLMDQIWHQQGVADPKDNHQTGIGISSGTIRIGDVLTLSQAEDREYSPEAEQKTGIHSILTVQSAFEKEAERICDWIDVINDERRQGGISRLVGMGEPINVAARLESISKAFPQHTAFIREAQFVKLPDDLMLKYEALEEVQLKGVDETDMIYGLPRYQNTA